MNKCFVEKHACYRCKHRELEYSEAPCNGCTHADSDYPCKFEAKEALGTCNETICKFNKCRDRDETLKKLVLSAFMEGLKEGYRHGFAKNVCDGIWNNSESKKALEAMK